MDCMDTSIGKCDVLNVVVWFVSGYHCMPHFLPGFSHSECARCGVCRYFASGTRGVGCQFLVPFFPIRGDFVN